MATIHFLLYNTTFYSCHGNMFISCHKLPRNMLFAVKKDSASATKHYISCKKTFCFCYKTVCSCHKTFCFCLKTFCFCYKTFCSDKKHFVPITKFVVLTAKNLSVSPWTISLLWFQESFVLGKQYVLFLTQIVVCLCHHIFSSFEG